MTVLKIAAPVLALMLVVYVFVEHSGFFPYEYNPLQYMPNMHHSKALIPQRGYSFYKNGAAGRNPPAGTIARDVTPYPYTHDTPAADVEKKANPLPKTKEVVLRGQHIYNSYCITCHGQKGWGNGLIVPPFPQPPSLQAEKIRNLADSQLFHIITVGQNTMFPYGNLIRENDRWAAVHYLRVLQRAENPNEDDLQSFDAIQAHSGENKK